MELSVTKQINHTTTLTVKFDNERDLKEALVKATWLMQISGVCGKCKSQNISLQGRVTKEGEFLYAEVYCKDCRAKQPLGEYKTPKGALFLKAWEDPYQKPNGD